MQICGEKNEKKYFHAPEFRGEFFAELRNMGWTAAERKYLYSSTRLKLWVKSSLPARVIGKIRRMIKK